MPPERKLKRDISGLKNQQKLTTNSSRTNEPMSCGPDTVAPPVVSPDLRIDNDADVEASLKSGYPICLLIAIGCFKVKKLDPNLSLNLSLNSTPI